MPPLAGRVLHRRRRHHRRRGRRAARRPARFGVMYQSGRAVRLDDAARERARCRSRSSPTCRRRDATRSRGEARAGRPRRVRPDFCRPRSPAACRSGRRSRARWRSTRAILFLDEPSAGLDPITSAELDDADPRSATDARRDVRRGDPRAAEHLRDRGSRDHARQAHPRHRRRGRARGAARSRATTRGCGGSSAASRARSPGEASAMSQKTSYFKLGLFVIGGIAAGASCCSSSARALLPEADPHRDVLQRVRAGSRRRVEAQGARRRDRRGHADRLHLQPLSARPPDVGPCALCDGGGADRAAALGWPRGRGRPHRSRERRAGSRARAPRAPRAAGDHRHELPRDRLFRSAAATPPDRLDARQHLHPEHTLDGHGARQRRHRNRRPAAQARHRGYARQPEPTDGDDERADRVGRCQDDLRPDVASADQNGDPTRRTQREEDLRRGHRAARRVAHVECRIEETPLQSRDPEHPRRGRRRAPARTRARR